MKKIYYAHHLFKYDTSIEHYELSLIHKGLPQYTVINPNGDIKHDDLLNESKIMDKCLSSISKRDVAGVVFSSVSGVVGKGVYDEVMHALMLGKEVYYIQNNEIHKCSHVEFEIINENRRLYAILKDY